MGVCYFPTRFSVPGAAFQLPMIRLRSGPKNCKSLRVGPEHPCFLKLLGTQVRVACAQGTYRITHLWVSNVSVNTSTACRVLRTQMSRPHPPSLGHSRSGVGSKHTSLPQAPGRCGRCWFRDRTLGPADGDESFSHCPVQRPRGKGGRGRGDCGLPLPLNKSVSVSSTLRFGVLSGVPCENKLPWLKTSESHQPSQGVAPRQKRLSKVTQQFFSLCCMKI